MPSQSRRWWGAIFIPILENNRDTDCERIKRPMRRCYWISIQCGPSLSRNKLHDEKQKWNCLFWASTHWEASDAISVTVGRIWQCYSQSGFLPYTSWSGKFGFFSIKSKPFLSIVEVLTFFVQKDLNTVSCFVQFSVLILKSTTRLYLGSVED